MIKNNKIEMKTWLTKGIKTSMKQRDKLYKEATKEKDSQRKIKKHETSKNY